MRMHIWIAALLFGLASCGGGRDSLSPLQRAELDFQAAVASAQAQAVPDPALRRNALAAALPPQIDPVDAAAQLMDFGEANFSKFFPSKQPNQRWTTFVYRYYPQTGAYLGVSEGNVYVTGGPFGSSMVLVGPLTDYITPVSMRAQATVGPAGGLLGITESASPARGVVLNVATGALTSATVVTVEPARIPPALDSDFTAVGPMVNLDAGGVRFVKPVQLTLPFSRATVAANESLGAFAYIEESSGSSKWQALPVVAYDAAAGKLTIETTRPSTVVVAKWRTSASVNVAFRPSLNSLRMNNLPAETLTSADRSEGFAGFARWYYQNYPSCPALYLVTDLTTQRTLIADAQAKSRLSGGGEAIPKRSALPWADFAGNVTREMNYGRQPVIGHVLESTIGAAADPENHAAVAWDVRTVGNELRIYYYNPRKARDDTLYLTRALYENTAIRTYLLPGYEIYDDKDMAGVFEKYKSALGCVPAALTLSAKPTTVTAGQTTSLAWSVSNARSCAASGDWSGSRLPGDGAETVSVGPTPGTRTYTLRCAGYIGNDATASAVVTVVSAPAANCASIGGTWTETATVDISCTSGDSDSATATGTGAIVQNGCNINYSVQGISRSGSVVGQRLVVTGPAGLVRPGVVLTRNTMTLEGTISSNARRIDATGTGVIEGNIDGELDSCTLRSRSVLTR